ncbi:hypothetical protein M9H77_07197 [Catharanthus roseus]|uniref:Uncharacterized protein n=1 Tax=Catharanthus roseus TaxID=4058 RepID=A0ACC0BUH8_CATRO|nr:hypothetical protein M9H77_07197 [Catharanthus roseus]
MPLAMLKDKHPKFLLISTKSKDYSRKQFGCEKEQLLAKGLMDSHQVRTYRIRPGPTFNGRGSLASPVGQAQNYLYGKGLNCPPFCQKIAKDYYSRWRILGEGRGKLALKKESQGRATAGGGRRCTTETLSFKRSRTEGLSRDDD